MIVNPIISGASLKVAQAVPAISVSAGGLITASAAQEPGFVEAGTETATKQLTVQAAQTITPGTTDRTIASGRYLTGAQTIKGDANLIAANIKDGVSIFGVKGSLSDTKQIDVVSESLPKSFVISGAIKNYAVFELNYDSTNSGSSIGIGYILADNDATGGKTGQFLCQTASSGLIIMLDAIFNGVNTIITFDPVIPLFSRMVFASGYVQ